MDPNAIIEDIPLGPAMRTFDTWRTVSLGVAAGGVEAQAGMVATAAGEDTRQEEVRFLHGI